MKMPQPQYTPELDPGFQPAVLADRAFDAAAEASGSPCICKLALEQADGSAFRFQTRLLPAGHPEEALNARRLERFVKFLLWSRGGCRVHVAGAPPAALDALKRYYSESPQGRFDAEIMGGRIYEKPFEIVGCEADALPEEHATGRPLGRHLEGCRIGFDLGASDRKVAAVVDGKVVFSNETVWHPVPQTDPQWHFDQIMDSLKMAAEHMPRVDAIGGSSAGVYVNNRVKVASLFRGVPPDLFASRVKDLFLEIRRAWNGIPFELVNDGEVTALAGSMSMNDNAVLGIALGSSEAVGYVTPEGNITSWLNELAFAPVDAREDGPVDEWSGDRGCGVQFFSQQAVNRLLKPAGIDVDPEMGLPDRLKHVQALMDRGDERAAAIYRTIGVYLGYGVAMYARFYDIRNVLILGRVTSGEGGAIILRVAQDTLRGEFPELGERMAFRTPSERDKRHGQAIAAASLPVVEPRG